MRTPIASTFAAKPTTRPSAPAAATSAWAPPSLASSSAIMLEETLARYPHIAIDGGTGGPRYVESLFINQLKTLPVSLAS